MIFEHDDLKNFVPPQQGPPMASVNIVSATNARESNRVDTPSRDRRGVTAPAAYRAEAYSPYETKRLMISCTDSCAYGAGDNILPGQFKRFC